MGASGRVGYVDWARGACVLLMLHTHAFYSWVRPEDHGTPVFGWTRFIGGYPGAIFLFLSGLVQALAAEAALRRGASPGRAALNGAVRGLVVLVWAFLFRLWMLATSDFAEPRHLLRVDVLNCIGVSLMLVSAAALAWRTWPQRLVSAVGLAAAIALATPLAWDSPLVARVPAALGRYVSGRLEDSLFPVFPWAGFAAVGAAAGLLLDRARRAGWEGRFLLAAGAAGTCGIALGLLFDRGPALYARYDFWHTSPSYFLVKAGVTLVVLAAAFLASALPGWSPLRQLGRTSLLVYWVHIEIVYGQYVAPAARGTLPVAYAAAGVVLLTAAMLILSLARTELPALTAGAAARGLRRAAR
jgi:uncharacterized membrane protein